MEREADWIRAVVILLLLAAPAIGVRTASHFLDDPDLQPLAATSGRVAGDGRGLEKAASVVIEVQVHWGEDRAGVMKPAALRDAIARSLASQTDRYRIRIDEVPGARLEVYFRVGPNAYGPYPPGRLRDGVHSALVALKASLGPEN